MKTGSTGCIVGKQGIQIDRPGHGTIADVPRVKVVAGIEWRRHAGGMLRITQHGIEIGHRIECPAVADPVVELPAQHILVRVVIVVERGIG